MTLWHVSFVLLFFIASSQSCEPWGLRLALGQQYSAPLSTNNLFITFNTDGSCTESYVDFQGTVVGCNTTRLANPRANFQTFVHICRVDGLRFLGRSYYEASYRAIGKAPGGVPSVRQAISMQLVNPDIKEDFKCLVVGDWGILTTSQDIYFDIIPRLKERNETFAAVIFLGDMAYDLCDVSNTTGFEDSCLQYPKFLKGIEFLTSRVPFMPTIGNHEYGPNLMYTQIFAKASFPVAGNINQYSFEIGNVRFQTVNFFEEVKLNNTEGFGDKMAWLEKDITKKSSKIDWVLPFSHYPFYCEKYLNDSSCRLNHYNNMLKPFLSYLSRNSIRLYLGAHIHLFRRSLPIGLDQKVGKVEIVRNETMTIFRNPDSPTFIIEGSGGNDYYVQRGEFPLEQYTDVQFVNTGFSILTSYADKPMIQNDHYLGKDGSIADSFAIEVLNQQLAISLFVAGTIIVVGLLLFLHSIIKKPLKKKAIEKGLLASSPQV